MMAQFRTAPIEEVAPKRRTQGPSQRAQVQQQYQNALSQALSQQQALVVVLEPEDKALTIRNRIKRAADRLGVQDIVIRRRGDQIIAFAPTHREYAEHVQAQQEGT